MNSSVITGFKYLSYLPYKHLRTSRAAETTEDTRSAENSDYTRAARLMTTQMAQFLSSETGAHAAHVVP